MVGEPEAEAKPRQSSARPKRSNFSARPKPKLWPQLQCLICFVSAHHYSTLEGTLANSSVCVMALSFQQFRFTIFMWKLAFLYICGLIVK